MHCFTILLAFTSFPTITLHGARKISFHERNDVSCRSMGLSFSGILWNALESYGKRVPLKKQENSYGCEGDIHNCLDAGNISYDGHLFIIIRSRYRFWNTTQRFWMEHDYSFLAGEAGIIHTFWCTQKSLSLYCRNSHASDYSLIDKISISLHLTNIPYISVLKSNVQDTNEYMAVGQKVQQVFSTRRTAGV